MALKISKTLTISTAHVKPETRECLDETDSISGTIDGKFYHLSIYEKYNVGWFIYIIPDANENHDKNITSELLTHPDLTACIKLAINNNCTLLCIGRDGDILYDVLPAYEY